MKEVEVIGRVLRSFRASDAQVLEYTDYFCFSAIKCLKIEIDGAVSISNSPVRQ